MKLAIIGIALLIGSCAWSQAPEADPVTQQACEERGGRWGVGGLAQQEMCFPNFDDAGLSCTAGSQCQGYCDAKTNQCSAGIALGCVLMLGDDGETIAICID